MRPKPMLLRRSCSFADSVAHGRRSRASWYSRYRNELETLGVLSDLCRKLGVVPNIDATLVEKQRAGEEELLLLARIRQQEAPADPVPDFLPEFATGRRLFGYQQAAVAKHLQIVHSADFSVPGSGKTSVALATWAHARRATPDLSLWVIGPLSCFSAVGGRVCRMLRASSYRTPTARQHRATSLASATRCRS